METWGEWETVRHQVAIWGIVQNGNGKPAARTQVTLEEMPEGHQRRVRGAAAAAGTDWDAREERLDRTLSSPDGIFFFLDLPAGGYTLRLGSSEEDSQSAAVNVEWTDNGRVARSASGNNWGLEVAFSNGGENSGDAEPT